MCCESGDTAGPAMSASPGSQKSIVESSQASAVAAGVSQAVPGLAQTKEPVP